MENNVLEMKLHDVIEIVQLFNLHRIEFYVDGGWGVDALLGKQTRPHADLDIAIGHKDSSQVRAPEWVVKFHTAYQFDEDDYRDVKAICQHFNIKMPLEYEEFERDLLQQERS
jgi:Aminoglycoside-2''-adenylyltransferase